VIAAGQKPAGPVTVFATMRLGVLKPEYTTLGSKGRFVAMNSSALHAGDGAMATLSASMILESSDRNSRTPSKY
jgi:hypothetical protein